jgi:hypothetical protein
MTELPLQMDFARTLVYDGKFYGSGAASAVLAARLKLKDFNEPKSQIGSGSKSKSSSKPSSSPEPSSSSGGGGGGSKKAKKKKSKRSKGDEKPWAVASPSPWKATKDPGTGKTYYFNSVSQAVQWDVPAEGFSSA